MFYNKQAAELNPYYNKVLQEDPQIDYLPRDLYQMNQYSLNEYLDKQSKSDVEIVKDIRNQAIFKKIDP